MPGVGQRHEEQRRFCNENNSSSRKRDSSGAGVIQPRAPTFTKDSPCDDTFFNNKLVGASEQEKLVHAVKIVEGIYRKELVLMSGGRIHLYCMWVVFMALI